MLHIAGGIILAILLLWLGGVLVHAMFSGFYKNAATGLLTLAIFGPLLFGLAMCVFG